MRKLLACLAAVPLLLAGCSGDDGASSGVTTTESTASRTASKTGPKLVHVVMGDSYSSGDGSASDGDGLSSAGCGRSTNAWAEQLHDLTSADLDTVMLACPGATRTALTTSFQGDPPQIEEMAKHDPGLVTVSIGGNDVGFVPSMIACYQEDCVADGALIAVAGAVNQAAPVLAKDYAAIKKAAPAGATVAVIGYPDLFGTGGLVGCDWMTPTEQQGVEKVQELLDQQIAAAAATADVQYVSLSDALAGHEMCTTDPWLNPVQGGEGTAAHPNTKGQLAMAQAIRKALAAELPAA